jgi:hypothetical protein
VAAALRDAPAIQEVGTEVLNCFFTRGFPEHVREAKNIFVAYSGWMCATLKHHPGLGALLVGVYSPDFGENILDRVAGPDE